MAPIDKTDQQPDTTPAAQTRPQIQIDDSKIIANYANFCRVTGTPEELIIDFGLNPQPFGVPTEPIPVTQRIVNNFYTAKRMLHARQLTIQCHEATFGVLETDVQRHVQPSAPRRRRRIARRLFIEKVQQWLLVPHHTTPTARECLKRAKEVVRADEGQTKCKTTTTTGYAGLRRPACKG